MPVPLSRLSSFCWLIEALPGSQWRVAARKPKGLAAIVPWEGMSDYYRDRCRHGGILSNGFIKYLWNRQVITNQYGRPGRAASNWGEDTIEGDLPAEELYVRLASKDCTPLICIGWPTVVIRTQTTRQAISAMTHIMPQRSFV